MTTLGTESVLYSRDMLTFPGQSGAGKELWNDPAELKRLERWRALQDELLRWRQLDRSEFERGTPPSSETIDGAIDFAIDCCDAGLQPPTAAAPNSDAGITFEWRQGSTVSLFEVVRRGRVVVLHLSGSNIIGTQLMVRTPSARGVR